jgi:hypothetical protein
MNHFSRAFRGALATAHNRDFYQARDSVCAAGLTEHIRGVYTRGPVSSWVHRHAQYPAERLMAWHRAQRSDSSPSDGIVRVFPCQRNQCVQYGFFAKTRRDQTRRATDVCRFVFQRASQWREPFLARVIVVEPPQRVFAPRAIVPLPLHHGDKARHIAPGMRVFRKRTAKFVV